MIAQHRAVWAIALIVACTVAVVPAGMNRFVFPKLLVVALAIAVGAFASRRGALPRTVTALLGTGAAALVLAALWGDAPVAQVLGRWPRYEGVVVLGLYVGAAWLGARLLHHDADRQRVLFGSLSIAAISLAAYSTLEAFGVQPMGAADAERTGGLLGNATDLGIVGSIIVALLVRPAAGRDWLCVAGTAAALLVVVLSGSRAAMLGTLVALVVLALASRQRSLRVATIAVGVGAGALALALPQMRDRLTAGHTITGRSVLWRDSIDLVGDHWVLGVGPSGYFDAVARYHGTAWVRDVGVANPPDSPHAWWLQAAAAGGVPLAILALALAAAVLVIGVRAVRAAPAGDLFTVGALAMVVAYGVELSTHFTTSGTTPLAAFIVGGLVARGAPPRHEVGAPIVGAMALAAAVIATTGIVSEIHLERGIRAVQQRDAPSAVDSFESAIQWRFWDSDTKMLAAANLANLAAGRDIRAFEPTIRWARESLDEVPDNRTSHVALGVAATAAGDHTTAIRALDAAIRLAPTEPQAYVQRGIAKFLTNDVIGAFADLNKALELDPDDQQAAQVLAAFRQQLSG